MKSVCINIVERFATFIKEEKSTDFYLTGGFSKSRYLINCILENETLKNVIMGLTNSFDPSISKQLLIKTRCKDSEWLLEKMLSQNNDTQINISI